MAGVTTNDTNAHPPHKKAVGGFEALFKPRAAALREQRSLRSFGSVATNIVSKKGKHCICHCVWRLFCRQILLRSFSAHSVGQRA